MKQSAEGNRKINPPSSLRQKNELKTRESKIKQSPDADGLSVTGIRTVFAGEFQFSVTQLPANNGQPRTVMRRYA